MCMLGPSEMVLDAMAAVIRYTCLAARVGDSMIFSLVTQKQEMISQIPIAGVTLAPFMVDFARPGSLRTNLEVDNSSTSG